jgi:hypothetical protein
VTKIVEAQLPPREKTLIVAHTSRFADPENWNILLPTAVSRSASGMHQFIYEYFFYLNLETGELSLGLLLVLNIHLIINLSRFFLERGLHGATECHLQLMMLSSHMIFC